MLRRTIINLNLWVLIVTASTYLIDDLLELRERHRCGLFDFFLTDRLITKRHLKFFDRLRFISLVQYATTDLVKSLRADDLCGLLSALDDSLTVGRTSGGIICLELVLALRLRGDELILDALRQDVQVGVGRLVDLGLLFVWYQSILDL